MGKSKNSAPAKRSRAVVPANSRPLLRDVTELIRQAREATALAVNSALVRLYWQVGHGIRSEVLRHERAEYGRQILSTLSKELVAEFGNGYSVPNLSRMMRLAEVFPQPEILSTLSKELGWSHFVEIIPLNDELKRDFYAEMCRVERWSVRTLRKKIGGMLFERTALSRKPEELAKQELARLKDSDQLSPDLVFRDPYFLDFLGLKDTYSEYDVETAIIRELGQFILEIGTGFAFVARQKRIVIDGKDFYIDLHFFHRKLRRLVAIDLKLGTFEATDKGQMELYLRWLEKHETGPDEEPPVGLILCEDKGEEQIELLQLDRSGIRVAAYLTELPPKEVLRKKAQNGGGLGPRTTRTRVEPREIAGPVVRSTRPTDRPSTTRPR
jgi:predicted nuclease of restriction endonuclease-like (RecB) superfamily